MASTYKLLCNITFIKPVVCRHDCLFTILSFFQCRLFSIYHFGKCLQKVFLHKYFSCFRGYAWLAGMSKKYLLTVWPLFNRVLVFFDTVRCLRLNWVTRG